MIKGTIHKDDRNHKSLTFNNKETKIPKTKVRRNKTGRKSKYNHSETY